MKQEAKKEPRIDQRQKTGIEFKALLNTKRRWNPVGKQREAKRVETLKFDRTYQNLP
jgi:hypothetical protein